MDEIKRALLGDREAAKWLTDAGVLAVRGRPARVSASVHSLIEAPVGRHSAKPKEARARIEALMGDVPRIELFARERIPGWDCWGDEVC